MLARLRVFTRVVMIVALGSVLGPVPVSQAQLQDPITSLLNPEGTRLFPQTIIFPRHPGKPDLRWRSFQWKYAERGPDAVHYRLYFYQEEEWAAQFTAPRIERQIEDLKTVFNFNPSAKFSYLLFTSAHEFRQTRAFDIPHGTQGITSTEEPTMAIPYWGDPATFDHISKHEMVHQFQVQKALGGSAGPRGSALEAAPLWFIEGMAEYYSLNGMNAEARLYLHDIALHTKKKEGYELPGFFENGPMSFITIYKVGQAKINFLEKEFGIGTVQKILDALTHVSDGENRPPEFAALVSTQLGIPPEAIEKKWKEHFERNYGAPGVHATQDLKNLQWNKTVGDNLDVFALSPDERLLAYRTMDPLDGTSEIRLYDYDTDKSIKVTEDNQPSTLSLYFMEGQTLTVSNHWIGYLVETPYGPEIEFRHITRDSDKNINIGPWSRLKIEKLGTLQTGSLSISPDEKSIAWIGIDPKGWANIHVAEDFLADDKHVPTSPNIRKLTNSFYSWKSLSWTPQGMLVFSNRADPVEQSMYRLDPATGHLTQLTTPGLMPSFGLQDPGWPSSHQDAIIFESWESGSSQVHSLKGNQETRLTDFTTGVTNPIFRGNDLLFLGFSEGRYRLFQLPQKDLKSIPVKEINIPKDLATVNVHTETWKAQAPPFRVGTVHDYKPFSSSGTRIDQLSAYLAGSSVSGIFATVSDLMRNYTLSGAFATYGSFKNNSSSVMINTQNGRITWTAGLYHLVQPKLDNIYSTDTMIETYLQRDFGGLAMMQYPLSGFSYVDFGLRVGGVNRGDYSDRNLEPAWNRFNPGVQFTFAPIIHLGYDGITYEALSGPLSGFGALLDSDTSFYPSGGSPSETLRLDLASYHSLFKSRTILALRGLWAGSWGGAFKNSFLVSSDDILRAYSFGDDRLYGDFVLAGSAELRFPVGSLIGFPYLRGLAAYDVGSVYRRGTQFQERVASAYSGGFFLNLPPLSLSFVLSYPQSVAPGPKDSSVFHFTLRYLYL